MKTKKVSEGYIWRFWAFMGEGYEIPAEILGLNLNNHASIEKLVNSFLKPELELENISWQYRCKESFRFAINFWTDYELKRSYDQTLAQLELPTQISIRDFYILVWNFLFDYESFLIEDKSLYEDIGPF
ncbi:hypothetical protein [Flavobacterium sharifuzzamanii]|uniref:hypothetical protein n=1 Tax=Flavobacterium sharifuzzamanii TaxID=2211133 RepID=UPI000DAD98B3|nr:hypothetical protein [Flavobacterium sharifuzzamanii]KAF2080566.1 hypothetical protein DMA14_14820 [Flavobacterium sharifuzzamanii]